MLLKGKISTLYFDENGKRVENKTENWVKLKHNITYRQTNLFYKLMSDPKYKKLSANKKLKPEEETEVLLSLVPTFIELLSTSIVDWSAVDENGNKMEITTETISDLEFNIMMELIGVLMNSFNSVQVEAKKQEDDIKN